MHKTMRSTLILFIILLSTLTVGCGSSVPVVRPFKMDIQQGNVVTSKMLLQLRPGMTKSQVKFIMGTPLINDSFHTNRWDYFYQMRRAGKVIEQRRVILDFEKELLVRVRGDVVPQGTPGADTGVSLSNEPSSKAKPVAKEGLLENLKFWKSNQDPEVEPANKSPVTEPKDIKPAETKSEATEQAAPTAETKSVGVEPEASNASSVVESEAPSMLTVPTEIVPSDESPSTAKPVAKEGLLENLKFWKSNQDPEVEPANKPPVAELKDIKPAETKSEATEQVVPTAETKSVGVEPEASKASSVRESDPPSMLALPIEIAPSEPPLAPVISPTPTTVEPINTPAVVTPSQVPTKAAPIEPAPEPASVKAYDQFIFRLDKDLDTKSLENSQKVPAQPSTQSKATDEKTVPAEDLGYFERMLEKIGF
ncbi:Outer membrane protein assembly factor BamE [Methylophilaceae bacterium]